MAGTWTSGESSCSGLAENTRMPKVWGVDFGTLLKADGVCRAGHRINVGNSCGCKERKHR
jgi:hypothetical protein